MNVQEFLDLPELEGEKMELIDGAVVRSEPSKYLHEITKSNILHLLLSWLVQNPAGKVFGCSMFQLSEVYSLMPDVSVLFPGPMRHGSTGLLQGAPGLAIEVVSSDRASDLELKIDLYMAYGSKSAWAVYPEQRVVWVFDPSGRSRKFEQSQILEDPAIPGFSAPVSAIFEGI
jgi:Uma2 family endonuclease